MVTMLIEMFRFAPQRRQPYRIFAFGGGKSLTLNLNEPVEVDDETGYKILAECSSHIRQVEAVKKKKSKPKSPRAKTKEVPDEQMTFS
jgi:hypothetical protein